ncbi:MAG: hypothetical protein JWQ09_2962 [Segetibacter sp.]|nr:hypothetical protein [Segetibacter sp.]
MAKTRRAFGSTIDRAKSNVKSLEFYVPNSAYYGVEKAFDLTGRTFAFKTLLNTQSADKQRTPGRKLLQFIKGWNDPRVVITNRGVVVKPIGDSLVRDMIVLENDMSAAIVKVSSEHPSLKSLIDAKRNKGRKPRSPKGKRKQILAQTKRINRRPKSGLI